jgi:hypothetical protein
MLPLFCALSLCAVMLGRQFPLSFLRFSTAFLLMRRRRAGGLSVYHQLTGTKQVLRSVRTDCLPLQLRYLCPAWPLNHRAHRSSYAGMEQCCLRYDTAWTRLPRQSLLSRPQVPSAPAPSASRQ